MSRRYNKKSDYWKKFEQKSVSDFPEQIQANIEPVLAGEPFYTSDASSQFKISSASREPLGRSDATGSRFNRAALAPVFDR
jgi:hypothetical protein